MGDDEAQAEEETEEFMATMGTPLCASLYPSMRVCALCVSVCRHVCICVRVFHSQF
jgi:hypothetical protein